MTDENTQDSTPAQETVSKADLDRVLSLKQSADAEIADLKAQMKRYENIDPDEFHAMKDSIKQFERDAAKNPEEREEVIKQQLSEQFADKISGLESQASQLAKENHELKVVDKALEAIADRFNADTLPFIKSLIRESVDVNESGEFLVKDGQGKARLNGSAKQMTLAEYADELTEKYPSMAKSQTTAGGKQPGQKVSGNGKSSALPSGFNSWSQEQKQQWFTDNPEFKPDGFRLA